MKSFNILIALFLIFLSSCADFIEVDISKEEVKLSSPGDNIVTSKLNQTFIWEEVVGARNYKFQIATPNFETPSEFIVDTIVNINRHSVTLKPGKYQWRVQAINSAYATSYAKRNLSIDSTGSLSGQEVVLMNPKNEQTLTSDIISFEWEHLPMAERYIFQLTSPFQYDTIVSSNKITLYFNEEGTYEWKILAYNSTEATSSAKSVFHLNKNPLLPPTLISPKNDSLFTSLPIELVWKRESENISHDSLYLYTSNQSTLVAGFPKRVIDEEYSLTITEVNLNSGVYYWNVRSVNTDGELSAFSQKRSFRIQ
jgi:hypothetical protein